ncbi:hypothetical protein L3Y34_010673 [Caenorhabditis briggsae]|uniref:VWFA domain-containing protein n=1 Tax=Caenorhabditis briggsae TaxID=6238 RepID=A0AAE8ZS85_CAEBR|nr:hypothetical protein L3Y34_010673 [Caenorhabditis briggsae]
MAWLGEDDMGYTSPAVPRRDVKWYLLEDTDNRVKWFTGILVIVSVGMLIAGSVMLGIGISKNNSNPPPPVNLNASGYTMFLNVRTKDLPYSAVLNDYSGSVKNLTEQMRQAISPSRASEFTVQPDVPITILGISNAGQWADVMYALSYIESTKPSISDIQKQVTNSEAFSMISAIDQTPPALTQMTCASVADAMLTTVSPAVPTSTPAPNTSPKGSTAASSSFGTVAPATGSTVTQPTVTTTTKSAPVTITTVTTPPVTRPTELARTTTTPFVKTPFSMDVIILLDDSKAMQTAKNFNQVKSWLDSTLLPLWLIDREDVQVAFATYADTEFNTLLDFDEANEKEVTDVISAQMYSGKFNSSITNGIRAAGDIHGLRPVNQTVILISASEDLTDIESATQYAYILNTLPKQLITITLNSATSGKQLGLLSTNQNHYFGVADFNLTSDIAQQLTQVMFGSLTPSTALPPTPTPSAIPDNACKTDVTILVDNTNDVGSIDEFQNQVRTISKLIKTWPISPKVMEGEAVVFGTKEGGQIIENAFKYQTASAFAKEVMAFDDLYFPNSSPSLTASLQYLAQNLGNRRADRQQATLVFTYSSDNSDALSAIPFANQIGGNLIIVAIGSADQTVLKQLSGNVIYVKNMTTDIIDQVNSLLCSPSTRAPLITIPTAVTNKPTITTVVSTQPPSTTQSPPTTPKPDFCPDCYPKTSNILIMFEASGITLTSQKKLVDTDLITNWTHFERTSVMGFATSKKFVDPLPFNGVENKDDFVSIVDNAIIDLAIKPTIVAAFTMATNQANPLHSFGRMNTVIFTSGATDDEINSSVAMSSMLRYNGKVILVGLKLTDTTGLNSLCDVLINWEDFTSTATIAAQINQALNS